LRKVYKALPKIEIFKQYKKKEKKLYKKSALKIAKKLNNIGKSLYD
jgi:hypothetical protein